MGGDDVMPVPLRSLNRKRVVDQPDLYEAVVVVGTHSTPEEKLAAAEVLYSCDMIERRVSTKLAPEIERAVRKLVERCAKIYKTARADALKRAGELTGSVQASDSSIVHAVKIARQIGDGSPDASLRIKAFTYAAEIYGRDTEFDRLLVC